MNKASVVGHQVPEIVLRSAAHRRRLSVVLWFCVCCGCGSNVQRAAVVPNAAAAPPRAVTNVTSDPSSEVVEGGRPLEIKPAARKYIVDTSRSHFEVFGKGTMGGEYKMMFTDWSARVNIDPTPSPGFISVIIKTDSVQLDIAAGTGIVRRHLLETNRYPTATLNATISRTNGPADEHIVVGMTNLHGVRKTLRFMGKLTEEGEGYRFKTEFIISRKEFNIRYSPIEPFLKDDVRIVVDAIATPMVDEEERERR